MKIRFVLLMVAFGTMALLPAAQAEHHESKGKGKGHEKAVENPRAVMPDAREHARGEGEERAEEAREGADRGREAMERAGENRGDEMRGRRDERKTIMAEAKENAEPGTPRAGKKPWWRFWETDQAE